MGNPQPPFYPAVQKYFDEHAISDRTPRSVRTAVIAVRSAKLPDPNQIANNGSFFANPIVDESSFVQINADYENVPHWLVAGSNGEDKVKLSAAWLLDQAGFKDYHDQTTGMATWPNQTLVLVNEHAKTTADVIAFKQKLIDAVQAKFNITLEQEPELLPIQ